MESSLEFFAVHILPRLYAYYTWMQQRDSILGQVKYVRCVSLIELGVNSVSAEKGEGYDFDATTGFIQFWGELNTWYVRCVSLWHSRLSREHETPKAYKISNQQYLTMAEPPASPLLELLWNFNEDKLQLIKEMAERDKSSIPKDFIAQCLFRGIVGWPDYYPLPEDLKAHYLLSTGTHWDDEFMTAFPPSIDLFVKTFTWFLEEIGSPGYYGLGTSKEEVDPEVNMKFLSEIYPTSLFFPDLSLEVTRSLIYLFQDASWLRREMENHVWAAIGGDQHPDRWAKFKLLIETLKTGSDDCNQEEDWSRSDEGSLLTGHCLVCLILKDSDFCFPWTSAMLEKMFLFVKQNQPTTFILQNQHGSTMMDLMLRYSQNLYPETVALFAKENPEVCLICGADGRLPVHVAIDKRYPVDMINLILHAAPSVATVKCPVSGLYPFLLAAAEVQKEVLVYNRDYRVRRAATVAATEMEIVDLIYKLLQQCPALVADGIAPDNCEFGRF
jgi:hypothetical protein